MFSCLAEGTQTSKLKDWGIVELLWNGRNVIRDISADPLSMDLEIDSVYEYAKCAAGARANIRAERNGFTDH